GLIGGVIGLVVVVVAGQRRIVDCEAGIRAERVVIHDFQQRLHLRVDAARGNEIVGKAAAASAGGGVAGAGRVRIANVDELVGRLTLLPRLGEVAVDLGQGGNEIVL